MYRVTYDQITHQFPRGQKITYKPPSFLPSFLPSLLLSFFLASFFLGCAFWASVSPLFFLSVLRLSLGGTKTKDIFGNDSHADWQIAHQQEK